MCACFLCILLDLSFDVPSAFRRGLNSTFAIIASPPLWVHGLSFQFYFLFFLNCIKWQTGRRNVNMSRWTGHSSSAYHSAQIIKAAGSYCETVSMRLHRPRTGKQHREQPSGKQHLASSLWTEQQESKPGAGGSAAGHHTKQTIIEWATIRPYTTIGKHNWNSGDSEATENTFQSLGGGRERVISHPKDQEPLSCTMQGLVSF